MFSPRGGDACGGGGNVAVLGLAAGSSSVCGSPDVGDDDEGYSCDDRRRRSLSRSRSRSRSSLSSAGGTRQSASGRLLAAVISAGPTTATGDAEYGDEGEGGSASGEEGEAEDEDAVRPSTARV